MDTPKLKLCKKHFFQVAGYFGKDVAFEFEVDGDSCLICEKVIFIEGARRYVEQNRPFRHNRVVTGVSAE